MLIALILFSNNSFAFKFCEIESGITYEEAISFAKQNSFEFQALKNLENPTLSLKYFFNNENFNITLEFSKTSKRLYSLTMFEYDSEDSSIYNIKFEKLKSTLDNTYGKSRIENYTIGVIGVTKTIPDNPKIYIYKNNEDEITLTFSKKIPLLMVRYCSNKYK